MNKGFVLLSVCSFLLVGCNGNNENLPVYHKYLTKTDNTSNFCSRKTKVFNDINNCDVTVDYFNMQENEGLNNPNVGEGILIKQCIDYKIAHPYEDVCLDITSFHFSTYTAVNLDRNSPYYGNLIPLVDKEYDDYGFYRISYLLVEAAKYGINCTVINNNPGYYFDYEKGKPIADLDPQIYFPSHYDDDCYFNKNEKVSKYLNYVHCDWKNYGDKSAVDMMHFKCCAVNHYVDINNVEHKNTTWLSSTNLDSVLYNGVNANNAQQSGFIVSDHKYIYDVCHNYISLLKQYCKQEDVYPFRKLIQERNKEQIDLIYEGKDSEIKDNERVAYLGNSKDDVFEMICTPLSTVDIFDEKYNPICKYVSELCNSDSYIEFGFSNVKMSADFSMQNILLRKISNFAKDNPNLLNKIYIDAPIDDNSKSYFDGLSQGSNIGLLKLGATHTLHNKDYCLSYVKDSIRYFISINTSMNFHPGAFYGQSNNCLIIKEKENDNDIYNSFVQNTFYNFK